MSWSVSGDNFTGTARDNKNAQIVVLANEWDLSHWHLHFTKYPTSHIHIVLATAPKNNVVRHENSRCAEIQQSPNLWSHIPAFLFEKCCVFCLRSRCHLHLIFISWSWRISFIRELLAFLTMCASLTIKRWNLHLSRWHVPGGVDRGQASGSVLRNYR